MAYEPTPKSIVADFSGDNDILAEDTDSREYSIIAMSIIPTSDTAVSFYLHDGDGSDLLGDSSNKITIDKLGAEGQMGFIWNPNPDGWITGKALVLNLSAAVPVIVQVTHRAR